MSSLENLGAIREFCSETAVSGSSTVVLRLLECCLDGSSGGSF